MGFSVDLRSKCAASWDLEKRHPFVLGIGDGTLPLDTFRYFMRQDYLYLIGFSRAIAIAAAKAATIDDMGWFAWLLHETLNTEMSLHVSFCAEFSITEQELESTSPSPTTLAYTHHLVGTALSGGVEEIAAAILPCSWGYSEIGKMLEHRGLPTDSPLYVRWIEMYASDEFADLAAWLRDFVDRTASSASEDNLRRMEEAFVLSSRYEYMFWDAAYLKEKWPV